MLAGFREGIPPAALPHIFNASNKCRNGTRKRQRFRTWSFRTGYAQAHGSSITVSSKPGRRCALPPLEVVSRGLSRNFQVRLLDVFLGDLDEATFLAVLIVLAIRTRRRQESQVKIFPPPCRDRGTPPGAAIRTFRRGRKGVTQYEVETMLNGIVTSTWRASCFRREEADIAGSRGQSGN
jgi:hypothetical protein